MEVTIVEKVLKEVEVVKDRYSECDKCKSRIKSSLYDSFKCEFIYQEGNVYPEGGSIDQTTMELCQKCGKELVETLKSLGYRLNLEELNV